MVGGIDIHVTADSIEPHYAVHIQCTNLILPKVVLPLFEKKNLQRQSNFSCFKLVTLTRRSTLFFSCICFFVHLDFSVDYH